MKTQTIKTEDKEKSSSNNGSSAERAEIPLKEGELFAVAGIHDRNLKVLRVCLKAKVIANSDAIVIVGDTTEVKEAKGVIEELLKIVRRRGSVDGEDVETVLRLMSNGDHLDEREIPSAFSTIETPQKRIHLRSANQEKYYQASRTNDIVFSIGPAGTGKTYLAVAMAVQTLSQHGDLPLQILCQ